MPVTLSERIADKKPLIVITGPTATGKTALGVELAKAIGGEIISADSRQIYRGMDLGTGKDLEEYGTVPYHLIDIAPAGYRYNLYEWIRDARHAIAGIRSRRAWPVVVGGTGLYVETLLKGIDLPQVPENPQLRERLGKLSLQQLTDMLSTMKTLHNTTDIDTAKRAIRAIEIETYYALHPDEAARATPHPVTDALTVIIDIDRDKRRERITQRLHRRLECGMVDEVRELLQSGIRPEDLEYYGLEYKYLTWYVTGKMPYRQMVTELEIAIHQFAKRQMTWFRGMERRGIKACHIPYDIGAENFVNTVITKLNSQDQTL